MSRCIPFPPPGYLWNGVGDEPLLQLLELRRVRAESKEKRRRKKEKRKQKYGDVRKKICDNDRKHKDGKSRKCEEKNDNQMRKEHENPGLENSTLTEELGQPITPPDDYNSLDNRLEIKKEAPRLYQNGCNDHERIVRGSFQFNKDPEVASMKLCHSTCAWMDAFAVADKCELACTLGQEKSSTSKKVDSTGKGELSATENFETSISTISESRLLETESEYRKLIVNWVRPPLKMVQTHYDDREWLSKMNLSRSERIRDITFSNDFYQGSYPYARYLPDADIYALPFILPF